MSTVRPLPAPPKVLYLRREMAWRRYRRTHAQILTAAAVFLVTLIALVLAALALGTIVGSIALALLFVQAYV